MFDQAAAALDLQAQRHVRSCEGQLVSFAVQVFDGRRNVATTFFGDYPQAVQDAEWFARTYCDF